MIKDIFMPLGSLLNAYGNINSGKGITPEQLIENTRVLVEFAQELVEPKQQLNDTPTRDIELPKSPQGTGIG